MYKYLFLSLLAVVSLQSVSGQITTSLAVKSNPINRITEWDNDTGREY